MFGHKPYTPDSDCREENVRDHRSVSGFCVTYLPYSEWKRESMSRETAPVRDCHLAILEARTRDLMLVAR
jgi:hypothetical protein